MNKPYKEMSKIELLQEIQRLKEFKPRNVIANRQKQASLNTLWKLYRKE